MDTSALIRFTQDLVREKSTTTHEERLVEKVVQEMTHLGFSRVWVDENGSAIGIIQGNHPGPTMLLDAHCDTVDAFAGDWTHDPYEAEIVGEVMYGRGTADTKGNLAAMVYAAAGLNRACLAGRVVVSATVNEEVMEGPALKSIMDAVHPDFVVIGEATDLNLNRGGRGRAEVVIESVGRSAHSSSPHMGLCAIHQMMRVIQAVEMIPVEIDPLLGPALLVLTDIISDPFPAHSVIANRCRATYDRRLLLGETMGSVIAAINDCAGLEGVDYSAKILFGEEATYSGVLLKEHKFYPAWLLPEDHPLVQGALAGLRSVGLSPALGAYRFCTNAAYSAGRAGIATVGFGLGTENDAHTVDEHIQIKHLEKAENGYRGIIEEMLK